MLFIPVIAEVLLKLGWFSFPEHTRPLRKAAGNCTFIYLKTGTLKFFVHQ